MSRFLAVAIGLLAAIVGSGPCRADETTLTIAGSGGEVADMMREHFERPFKEATGIEVKEIASSTATRLSTLKAMSASGKTIWDLVNCTGPEYDLAVQAGYLDRIDWSIVDPGNTLPPEAKQEYGLVWATYSTIMVVRDDRLPPGRTMGSWADFWDVKTFPGPRGLQNTPNDNLEFALLADGVPMDDLYTVLGTESGIDRAFRKLDEIKPHITAWWQTGAQPVQMLASGEVNYTSMYNARVGKLVSEGLRVSPVWNGGSIKLTIYSVPKGAQRPVEAQRFLNFMISDPKRVAAYVSKINYPGFIPGMYDHISQDVAKLLPTYPDNLRKQFFSRNAFWLAHQAKLNKMWQAWIIN